MGTVAGIGTVAHLPHVAALASAAMNPEIVLGSALIEVVRQVLRDELQARAAANEAPRSPWMTPPAAARLTRVPLKTIRAWARTNRIPRRVRNRSADPKQQKYLVNVQDVIAVAEQVGSAPPAETSDKQEIQQRAQERAAQVLAARAAARGR
jgi:hypothetical protein